MRRLELRFVTAALLLALPNAASAQQRVRTSRPAAPDGAVRIHNLEGSVRISGWDRDSILVEGVLPPGQPLQLHVAGPNAKLAVDSDAAAAAPAHLEVRVPADSRVWVRTAGATVTVQGVRGGVDVSTVAGGIDIRGGPAEVYAESMGGTVDVELDTRLLRVRTAGGDIMIRGRATDAEAYTVSGRITVHNKLVERGRFESVDGGIHYTGGIGRSSSVEFVSHGGPIELALPGSVTADLRISSFQGKVGSELGRLVAARPQRRGKEYSLTLGGGGAEIVIRTFKGDVRLRRM